MTTSATHKANELWKKHGLMQKEVRAMLESQKGLCAICGTSISLDESPWSKTRAVIDHCHQKNRPRGLLCQRCNLGLGTFGESLDRLISAVVYLKYWDDAFQDLPRLSRKGFHLKPSDR
jgi:hypothetical protein